MKNRISNFGRLLLLVLTLYLTGSFLWSCDGTVYAGEGEVIIKTFDEMTEDEKGRVLADLMQKGTVPANVNVNGGSYSLNSGLWYQEGIIVYGNTAAINAAVQTTGSPNYRGGMYRYWGYDVNGGLYGNDDFPRDSDSGTKPWKKEWLTVEEIRLNNTARNYVGQFAMTAGFDDGDKLATAEEFLEQNPDWVTAGVDEEYILEHFYFNAVVSDSGLTQGQFVGVHVSRYDNKLYYQTFALSVGMKQYIVPAETVIPEPEPEPVTEPGITVGAACTLGLPAFTYEGHPALAEDMSVYYFDGEAYSARRAYDENLAQNRFSIAEGGPHSLTRISSTRAEATFSNAGIYHVELKITPEGGSPLYDTKPIEVRNTPFIQHSLTGVQKQNRKQVVNLQIAVHPDYPLTELRVNLSCPGTGESVTLSHSFGKEENQLKNGTTIKTRPIEQLDLNAFFHNCKLEFLTKNTAAEDYMYSVYVKDSKGNIDTAESVFSVAADHPPIPDILMEPFFIRGENSNLAEIIAEDVTITDGDQLEREWQYKTIDGDKWTNAGEMNGYGDYSFGTAKKIALLKDGVGKFEIKLDVKDNWTEETLPEYVSTEDYLTGSAVVAAEVINVAPIISLEPVTLKEADIILLAGGKEEYETIDSARSLIKETLLKRGIDADIILERMNPNASEEEGSVSALIEVNTPFGYNGSGTFYEDSNFLIDNERLYKIDATWVSPGYDSYPKSPYTVSCWEASSGNLLWTYTFTDSVLSVPDSGPYLAQDDSGRYLFFSAGGKTLMLTKDTGSFLTVLDVPVGKYNFAEADIIFTIKNDGIYSISTKTGRIKKVFSAKICGRARRLEGKIHFLAVDGLALFRGIFDPATETVHMKRIMGNENDDGRTSYNLEGVDTEGKFIISCITPEGSSFLKGIRVYGRNDELIYSTSMAGGSPDTSTVSPIYDSSGACTYLCYTYSKRSGSSHYVYVRVSGIYNGYSGLIYARDENGYPTKEEQVLFAREVRGKVYVATGAYWIWIQNTNSYGNGPAHGYPERTTVFVFDPASGSAETGKISDLSIGAPTFEYGLSSDTMTAIQSGDNNCGLGSGSKTSVLSWDQTLTEIIRRYMTKNLSGEKDINTVIIVDETNPSEFYSQQLIHEFTSYADSKNGNFIVTDKETVANGGLCNLITAAESGERNTLCIEVSDTEGEITKKYNLDANTVYYYEYDIKCDEADGSDADSKDFFNLDYNMNSVLPEEKLTEDGYKVLNMYLEDFNDSTVEPFFKLSSSRIKDGLYYGAHAYKTQGSNWENYYVADFSSLTFTVPEGKTAVLSFDWTILMDGEQLWTANYISINSDEWQAFTPQSGSGHYTHPILLKGGENTLSFYAGAYGGRITEARMWIDNLRLDIVEQYAAAPGESGQASGESQTMTHSIIEGPAGYLHVGGTFKTPPTAAAYRAQADTEIISGPIGAAPYTEWTSTIEGRKKAQFSIPPGKTAVYTQISTLSTPRVSNDRDYGVTYIWGEYKWYCYARNQYPQRAMTNIPSDYEISFPAMSGIQEFSQSSSTSRGARGTFTGITAALADEPNSLTNDHRFFIAENKDGEKNVYVENERFENTAEIGFRLPMGRHLIRNLSIYTIRNGVKVYAADETFSGSESLLEWETSGADAAIVKTSVPKEEEQSLVYQKGQVIDYSIFYYDYEGDPSKKQYWKYTHTPFNNGPHPDAAVILDETGNPESITGTILNEPIKQFYIDGKYILEHWQEDNTTRPVIPEGNPEYDKLSNVESITFYIGGGASAPWIESIKTDPAEVTEGDNYSLIVKVNDLEKDELRLLTEIYKEGKIIYSERNTGITADSEGNYAPVTITGQPTAKAGKYEVICTVRDDSGAGTDSYRFTVTSLGKITGIVYHTDEWDQNRKKYNLHYFGEEFNRDISYSEYLTQSPPRKRGTNVFWSGERLMLSAEVAGDVKTVTAYMSGFGNYQTTLQKTGMINSAGEAIYEGSLWNREMINKWGRLEPEELTVRFTAEYGDGITKTFDVPVIIDSGTDYWLLHRLW